VSVEEGGRKETYRAFFRLEIDDKKAAAQVHDKKAVQA